MIFYLDACLRAIPEFVKAERTSDNFHPAGRRVELRLAYR